MRTYVTNKKDLQKELNKDYNGVPAVIISSGLKYMKIADIVENSVKVILIALFCLDINSHKTKLQRHIKIFAVVDTFEDLKTQLKINIQKFLRFSYKFLDCAEENTFYELKDQKLILEGHEMKGVFLRMKETSHIHYIMKYLTLKKLDGKKVCSGYYQLAQTQIYVPLSSVRKSPKE